MIMGLRIRVQGLGLLGFQTFKDEICRVSNLGLIQKQTLS